MLSESLLRFRLEERGPALSALPLVVLPETGSTNDDAKALAREGPDSPVLIAASRQTAGRGRRGRTFLSPEGGLYMSLLIPLAVPAAEAVGATGCAAVAACRAVEECAGLPARIKWVNDILVNSGGVSGKAAGILCETAGDGSFLVIGIGVNTGPAPLLEGADYPALSLSRPGRSAEPELLCAALADGFLKLAADGFDFRSVAEEYRSRSAVLGKEIVFLRDGTEKSGIAEAVLDDGSLLVRCADGPAVLNSGAISVRQKRGGRIHGRDTAAGPGTHQTRIEAE